MRECLLSVISRCVCGLWNRAPGATDATFGLMVTYATCSYISVTYNF